MDCCCPDSPDFLSKISNIATIATAVVGLVLAFYVFIHQRRQDKFSNKLQWFKDLIIEPNKDLIYEFFENIVDITDGLRSSQLVDLDKSKILSDLKSECANFRRNFIVLLRSVDPSMEKDIKELIDLISDTITIAAFNASIDLSDSTDFDVSISMPIARTKNQLFERLFQYDGKIARR